MNCITHTKIITIVFWGLFLNTINAQTTESFIQTKSGEKILINPDIGILGWSKSVYYRKPSDDKPIIRGLLSGEKIKKNEIDKIIIGKEFYLPLDTKNKQPYPFRIIAENDNYTLGITPRIKSSNGSYFTRDYYGIYDKNGKEIVFDKLNRDKKKSIKVIKKYFGECLAEHLPTEKSEIKSYKYKMLKKVNQLKCD